ncbi:hypothetical protein HN014_09915 [Aquimarina sp. TRL1]|uniref:hypothetical protein n=1 Tax=Aquimarina sp. (strain TRL1) TaxID=2736252 RepID=UPI00158ED113|nr:hypothetical protein [Aquimarina sp. TRL1]QKX05220.1 hypothetical protein HN014_09915 [Aquimarina sp. TRL1]
MKTTNLILLLLLYLFPSIFFSQTKEKTDKVLRINKTLALELCDKKEFNLCFNFSPLKTSKNPEFVSFSNEEINYDVVYKIPPVYLKIIDIDFSEEKKIFDLMLNPSIETDTLKYGLTKKQIRKVKKHIKKTKKTINHNVSYSFDGNLKYLLYDVDFECVYGGVGKTYIIDKDGHELRKEIEAEIYYLTKIISIKPKYLK